MSRLERFLPFGLLALMAIVIAVATVVEDAHGTRYAKGLIYSSLWFKLLWGSIAFSGIWLLWKRQLWLRFAVFMLHVSFLLILVGAFVTSVMSKGGSLHLRQGVPTGDFLSDQERVEHLPFLIRLDTFLIRCYPGTETPQDYISHITCQDQQYVISMNHIAKMDGYRFYQSSYDQDRQGSILSVNYDPWGTRITYFGYALLGLSMMIIMLQRMRNRGKSATSKLLLFLLLMCFGSSAYAALPVVPQEKVSSMERGQVMWNDRVTPIGTMGQEFLLKVYGKRSYHGLSGTQVLISWALSSKEWSEEPIIKVKDKKLRQQLGIEGKYASMHDFFDADNHYKLSEMAPTRAVQEVDEKMGLIFMLLQGTLIHPVPAGVKSLSDTQVSIELFYNRINWTLWSMIGCFVFALFSFVFRKYWWHKLPILLLLAFLLASFFLRWYIAGRLPLSNGYETMIFLAICLVTGTYLVHIVAYVPVLCAGFMLLVAHLGEMNPQITQLMPVLHSPWLSIHVSVIMMSYALLILSFMERRLLEPAVFLLAAGIFLGAVWANVSWGTYWSWDPKESWALITLIVYSLPLHTQSLPWFRSTRNYRIYSILALCSLLMTYFGVNYLLGGMHSYAG